MKQRPMVLIFTGILSGTAVVWKITSMATAFYILAGICLLIILLFSDRRYGWIVAGMSVGILLSLGFKTSMELDLLQVRKNPKEYTTGKVLEVSKTKKGKLAVLLRQENLEGKILLYTSGDRIVRPGDFLRFDGKLEEWEDSTNPGQFSSRHYYFSKGIYYHVYSKNVEVKGHQKVYFTEILSQCKKYIKHQLKMQYKQEVRRFFYGMLLGDKNELSDEVKDDFKESGLIHLLAVSGLHISLAGRRFYQLVRRRSGNFIIGSFAGMSGAVFYCALTGGSGSSLRAVIMLCVYFLSEILGEHYDMLSAGAFAGSILLMIRPYRVYDTGFLYSFTAVFVIGLYQNVKPKIRGRCYKLKESLIFCIFIQMGMLPLVVYFQYEAPIFSFLANIVAIPLATYGFTFAFLLIFLPYTVFHEGISWMIEAVLWISRQSYGMLTVGHVPFLWVILFYLMLGLCLWRKNEIKRHIRISLAYMIMIILIWIPMTRKKSLTFLDVGQGDCFVADTKAGLFISDGGSSSEDQVGRYRILPYIKYLGYQKVQIAIISHMDTDHYSGLMELLEMGRIKYLGLPEIPKDKAMEKLIKTAKKKGTIIFYLSKGRQITTKNVSLKVLHPEKNSHMEKNAASLVMQGNMLGYRVLLTGDVEKEGEESLLLQDLERVDLLKAAHHGSKNSTSNEFLQKVRPKHTIISCGKHNRYGHPHLETIHRLQMYQTKIHRTDQSGAIIFYRKRDS